MSEHDPQEESSGDGSAPDRSAPAAADTGSYRVLARKYRPATFAQLIGQEAMVRTLTNALRSGRLAHAFVLTGVLGVGKTTTARIIARALNCVGPDGGGGGPTADPCGTCEHCRAITEDRHVDVLEMDAAGRTGVDDIRELIEGVRYRPTSARYKVYIIDEVHMLSRNAFNPLLKTLEEPPAHVKFVFATTEARKLPVTVLSRCQRFDLRRIDAGTLGAHLGDVAAKEGFDISEGALQLIARAADGSVRDGLSLLDQAFAHGDGAVDEAAARDMLGLADRGQTFILLEAVLRGDIPEALKLIAEQHAAGADPAVVLGDMLELTHWLTRIKIVPDAADAPGVPEMERVRGRDMAERLSMAALARAWQMLLKGLGEVRQAPAPLPAAEMILIRLAYAAELPTPAEAVKALDAESAGGAAGGMVADKGPQGPSAGPAAEPSDAVSAATVATTAPGPESASRPESAPQAAVTVATTALEPQSAPRPLTAPQAAAAPDPASFEDVIRLVEERKELTLKAYLVNNLHLVRFQAGRIEFRPDERAPGDLANRLSRFLNDNTARRWVVTVSREPGADTLSQQKQATEAALRADAASHPLVKAVMETFPGATISEVRPVIPEAADPADGAAPAAGEDEP